MKNNPLLSVIIPVYNVEDYLRACLDSVMNQTYTRLEIIIVNDGSTDNSRAIVEEYAQKDARIRVIDKRNGGWSSALNAGLDSMQGDLVTFVDSDDYLQLDTYAKNIPVFEAQNDVEIVQFPFCNFGGKITGAPLFKPKQCVLTGDEIFKSLLAWHNHCTIRVYTCNAWDKLYKKEIFVELRFGDTSFWKDGFLTIQYCKHDGNVKKVFISEDGCYYYRQAREGSITTSNPLELNKLSMLYKLELYRESFNNPLITLKEKMLLLNTIFWQQIWLFARYNEQQKKEVIDILHPYKIKLTPIIRLLFDSSICKTDRLKLVGLSVLGIKNSHRIVSFLRCVKNRFK
jgi:glycosyltransferase involved in cell wall biosynthesis